jgi:hypothetical protein
MGRRVVKTTTRRGTADRCHSLAQQLLVAPLSVASNATQPGFSTILARISMPGIVIAIFRYHLDVLSLLWLPS